MHAACHAHSVYGKAWSAFGRELDMITQDSLRFYNAHGVYKQFGGVVLASEEGDRIAQALGMFLANASALRGEQFSDRKCYAKNTRKR